MILWRSREDPETRGEHMPCRAFRWTFQAGGGAIGFVHQACDKLSGEWIDSHTQVFEVRVERREYWRLGVFHAYYDGPHCALCVGPVQIVWGGDPRTGWCDVCMPVGEPGSVALEPSVWKRTARRAWRWITAKRLEPARRRRGHAE